MDNRRDERIYNIPGREDQPVLVALIFVDLDDLTIVMIRLVLIRLIDIVRTAFLNDYYSLLLLWLLCRLFFGDVVAIFVKRC